MSHDYIPSSFTEKQNNTTHLGNNDWVFSAKGYFFDSSGNFLIEEFKSAMFDQKVKHEGHTEWAQQTLDNLNNLLNSNVKLYPYYDNETYLVKNYAKIKCCNKWFELHNFTNTCYTCYSDYNTAGQLLSNREFWGEETGESYVDIANVK